MTTRTLRAAALGFGLPFALALPLADGTIDLAERALLVNSYQAWPFIDPIPEVHLPTRLSAEQDYYRLTAMQDYYRLTFGG